MDNTYVETGHTLSLQKQQHYYENNNIIIYTNFFYTNDTCTGKNPALS